MKSVELLVGGRRMMMSPDPDVKDHREHDDLCNLAQERRGSGTFA